MPTVTKLNESASGGEATPPVIAWIDIDTSNQADRAWLAARHSFSDRTRDRLLQPVLVSRREILPEGLLVSLRISTDISVDGPGDPASLSILISDDQVITVRSEAIPMIDDLRAQLDKVKGASSPLQFLAHIATGQSEQIEGIIAHISKETDELEDQLLDEDSTTQGEALNDLRRRVYRLRRQLTALKHVLMLIVSDPSIDLDQSENTALKKTAELATHHLEKLEDCRIRIQLLRDQLEGRLAASMAQSSYNLTIVATVFLPLTFITGLLGMNVAGIPDAHDPRSFWTICILLTIFAAVSWGALRLRTRG